MRTKLRSVPVMPYKKQDNRFEEQNVLTAGTCLPGLEMQGSETVVL